MSLKPIVPGLYAVPLGVVNAFLVQDGQGLALIDTGSAGSQDRILAAVAELGKAPRDIHNILVTHLHADHSGSLAALKAVTGAPAWMHPLDAALVREGQGLRPAQPPPGLFYKLLYRLFMGSGGSDVGRSVAAVEIEHEVEDGQELPIAGGLQVVHTPGHSAGHVALLWPQGDGVLLAADAAANIVRLGYTPIYEDFALGLESLRKLSGLDFEVACFGHGGAITSGASARFRAKWGKLE